MDQKKEFKDIIVGVDNPKLMMEQYNKYLETLFAELKIELNDYQWAREAIMKSSHPYHFSPFEALKKDDPHGWLDSLLQGVSEEELNLFPELRHKLYLFKAEKENLHLFKKALKAGKHITYEQKKKSVKLAMAGLTRLIARNEEESQAIKNVLQVSFRYRPQFTYSGEDGTPVANSWVLFWRYDTDGNKKQDQKATIDFTDNEYDFFADSVGLAKTDEQGRLTYAASFADGTGKLFGKAQFCPDTGGFRILSEKTANDTVQKRLKKNNSDPFFDQQLMEVLSSHRAPFFERVTENQEKSTKNWVDIKLWSSACLKEGLYGFMPLPANMGDCEIENLATLPEKKLELYGKQVKVATKAYINENTPKKRIELHCNLREWAWRINQKRKVLQEIQMNLANKLIHHYTHSKEIDVIKEYMEIQSRFPFYYDSKGMQDSNGNAWKVDYQFGHILQNEKTREDGHKGNVHLHEELWKKAQKEYEPFQNRAKLVNACIQLKEGIHDHINNGEKYYLRNVNTKEILEKQSILERFSTAMHRAIYNEEEEKRQNKIILENITYETLKREMKPAAKELWALLRSEAFRWEFQLYMNRQKNLRLPADFEKQQEQYLNELKTYYDDLLDSDDPEETEAGGDRPSSEGSDPGQVVIFPIPFEYMKTDYYSGFLFDILNHSFTMLDGVLSDEVWKKEVLPGLETLARREELYKFGNDVRKKIEDIGTDMSRSGEARQVGEKLLKIRDTASFIDKNKESFKLPNSIAEIWARSWQTFVEYKDLISSTIVAAPGADCLLQASLKVFERHAISSVIKNPRKERMYIQIMTAVIAVCRFQLSKESRDRLSMMIARGFTTNVDARKAKDTLRLFLHDAAYDTNSSVPRAQLLSFMAIKTGFLVLNAYALFDEWEKLAKTSKYGDLADISRSITNYLYFSTKAVSFGCSSLLLVESGFSFFNLSSPLQKFSIGVVANRLAFGLSAIATADTSEQFLNLYFREGSSDRTTKAGMNALSN